LDNCLFGYTSQIQLPSIATETTHTLSNDDLSDDPAAATALSVQRSLRCIFKLNKTQTKINESRDTVDIL
jgi:hypothetical protein